MYYERLTRLSTIIAEHDLDAIIVSAGSDLAYFTDIDRNPMERLLWLVIPAHGSGVQPALVYPFLEQEAYQACPLTQQRAGYTFLQGYPWRDGENPLDAVITALGSVSARVAVSAECQARHTVPLSERLDYPLALGQEFIDSIRRIKTETEIEAILAAGKAIDAVHEKIPGIIKPGITEAEVAKRVAEEIILAGNVETTFVIIGSGPHGADPHHSYSDRKIESGDIIVVDIGGKMPSGYHSDCTRTYSLGRPQPEVARAYSILQSAQESGVSAIKPGVTCGDIDHIVRTELALHDLDKAFIHRLGHGIGLSVHESPALAQGSGTVIEPGFAFSIEPGIYFPGKWGARIEDIVVVHDSGAIRANNCSHELTIIAD